MKIYQRILYENDKVPQSNLAGTSVWPSNCLITIAKSANTTSNMQKEMVVDPSDGTMNQEGGIHLNMPIKKAQPFLF